MSKKIAVVGLGNKSRRDDGIGIIILESLLNFYNREEVDYLNYGSASFDLLHRINSYKSALFIDGINADASAGELKISRLKEIEYKLNGAPTSTHQLGLKDIFELSRRLGIKTEIYVAGIQVSDTSLGEGLSPALKNREAEITKEIAEFIKERLIR